MKNPVFLMRLLFFLIFLSSCQSELPHRKEKIYRKKNTYFYEPASPTPKNLFIYPWQEKTTGGYPRITKDFFRCKGSCLNQNIEIKNKDAVSYISDCSGNHSLPLKEGEEFVYPQLISILNYLQQTLEKKVIITTGHRCVKHNRYADSRIYNCSSKHMIGAEVDFYVQGLEEEPLKVIETILKYYPNEQFTRQTKTTLDVRTEPWLNKEIFIKLYEKEEGRDIDNLHPYPYISIQLRCDENKAKILFNQKQAEELRYD